jgi:hypothetical protein
MKNKRSSGGNRRANKLEEKETWKKHTVEFRLTGNEQKLESGIFLCPWGSKISFKKKRKGRKK